MNDIHILTEELKNVEVQIHSNKLELKHINSKLNIAYQYEDDLNKRLVLAKNNTESLRVEFFQQANVVTKLYDNMKKIFDLHTGNFFNPIKIN